MEYVRLPKIEKMVRGLSVVSTEYVDITWGTLRLLLFMYGAVQGGWIHPEGSNRDLWSWINCRTIDKLCDEQGSVICNADESLNLINYVVRNTCSWINCRVDYEGVLTYRIDKHQTLCPRTWMKAWAVHVSFHILRHWRHGVFNVCRYRVKRTHGCSFRNDSFTYVTQNGTIVLRQKWQRIRLVLRFGHFYSFTPNSSWTVRVSRQRLTWARRSRCGIGINKVGVGDVDGSVETRYIINPFASNHISN